MNTYLSKLQFLILFLLIVVFFQSAAYAKTSADVCPNNPDVQLLDCENLVAFYNELGGDSWAGVDWEASQIADWDGVIIRDERVAGLKLPGANLEGELPAVVGQFTELQVLSLGDNKLSGVLPSELSNLKKLRYLWLYNNQLSGGVPIFLSSMPELRHLYLFKNQFEGEVPESLSQLPELTELSLDHNNLTGDIPVELGVMVNLEVLSLSNNNLSGVVPVELTQVSSLKGINLGHNNLSGEIPVQLSTLQGLEFLVLSGNNLTGFVPPELSLLPKLQHLDLSGNGLTGEIPVSFGEFEALQSLNLGGNQLSGEIPSELANIETLQILSLSSNGFTGSMPVEISELPGLKIVELNDNNLSGDIAALFEDVVLERLEIDDINDGSKTTIIRFAIEGDGDILTPKQSYADGGEAFVIPEFGSKFVSATGCNVSLDGLALVLSAQSSSCTVTSTFESCDVDTVGACVSPTGEFSEPDLSVSLNTALSSFSVQSLWGDQLFVHGWMNEPYIEQYVPERIAGIQFGESEILELPISLPRTELSQEFRDHAGRDIAWAMLTGTDDVVNSLSEPLRIRVYTKEQILVADVQVESLQIDTGIQNSSVITGVTMETTVLDFPVVGHKTVVAFDEQTQSFKVVDQLDASDQSLLSNVQHFSDDGAVVSTLPEVNGEPGVSVLVPGSSNVLSGLNAVKGWLYHADPAIQAGSVKIQIDDEDAVEVERLARRLDNSRLGLADDIEASWWSYLDSGQLQNGNHRLRVFLADVLVHEALFASHTLLSSTLQQNWLKGVDKTHVVSDFPFVGSTITLRFDQAEQDFKIISQTVSP